MSRFIADYNHQTIDEAFLSSTDWDVIQLKFTVNQQLLVEWYNFVTSLYPNLEFSFINNNTVKEQYFTTGESTYGYSNRIYGKVTSWAIDWLTESDLPIPPPFAAKEEVFPEILSNTEYNLQKKYNIGYFNKLVNELGRDTFRFSRITKHDTNSGILGHVDGGTKTLRLHIPIVSSTKSVFSWGDNLERRYSFVPGNVYIINASVYHATENTGPTRAHIISDPPTEKLLDLLSITGSL